MYHVPSSKFKYDLSSENDVVVPAKIIHLEAYVQIPNQVHIQSPEYKVPQSLNTLKVKSKLVTKNNTYANTKFVTY